MRISKITIKNIMGVEELEIEPGRVTVLYGENGVGKTSVLEAIRSALAGGTDATLLRSGTETGESVILLDDGTEIRSLVTPDKTKADVVHPDYGKLPRPAQFRAKLSDALSLNPIEFLSAPASKRTDLLLRALPMTITQHQLGFVPTFALQSADFNQHALSVISSIYKTMYDTRTGVNRSEKDKRATARQMTDAMPAAPPEGGNWNDELEILTDEWRQLNKTAMFNVRDIADSLAKAKVKIDDEKQELIDAASREATAHVDKVKDDLQAAIDKLRAEAGEEIAKTWAGMDAVKESAEQKAKAMIDLAEASASEKKKALEAEFRPKDAELKEKIGKAKAMIEAHTKARDAQEFIKSQIEQADSLEAESKNLTEAIDKLEALKSNLLGQLPIKGLSVQDGDIYVDGIPFDRVNESKRIRLAIEIARMRAGSLGLIIVDGLERLDPKTFDAFKKQALKSDLQFVITRVSEGPLRIETEGSNG
jgi:ABC-type cobalamin/Fe3+-siderophores transport system ATPase subunit